MKLIHRSEYKELINKGIINGKNYKEYGFIPLDLSQYKLNKKTQKMTNDCFDEETTDRKGNYMLQGHWIFGNHSQSFCDECNFNLTQVDGYSSYGFSDNQLAIFIYCEGDISLTLFTDKEKYEKEKTETIRFYKEVY